VPNINESNQEVLQYFSTLPFFIQESIEQTGLTFNTVDELKSFVENLEKK